MSRAPRYDGSVKRPRRGIVQPRPKKELGQHFLRDRAILDEIAEAATPPPGGFLVEIGAGTGELTEALLRRHQGVVAIEVEPRLVRHLRRRFANTPSVRIIEGDARTIDLPKELEVERPRYAAVGNLPYYAANPIIRHFLEDLPPPTELVVMLQREVAQDLVAWRGKRSLHSISVEVYAEPELLFDVPPEAFDPAPKVWSSVVRLRVRPRPLVPREQMPRFFDLVARTFKNPRKQLHNALAQGIWLPPGGAREALERAGIDPARRPETLVIDEWLRLLETTEAVRAEA